MNFKELNLFRASYKYGLQINTILFSAKDLKDAFEMAENYIEINYPNCVFNGVSECPEKVIQKSYE